MLLRCSMNWTEKVGRKQTAEQEIIREFLVEITNKGDFHPILIFFYRHFAE